MPSVALSSTAARLLELQIQNRNPDLKEFIEAPPFVNPIGNPKTCPNIPWKKPHSYGANARSFQAESQYGNSVQRLDRLEIDKMLTGQIHLADFSPGL
jgi:hypothetical protein